MCASAAGLFLFSAACVYHLGYAFWCCKNIIKCPRDHDEDLVASVEESYGFLHRDFEPKYFFWEMIVLLRKFLVVSISIWFPPATSMASRTLLLGLMISASMGLTSRHRPFKLDAVDTLDMLTQGVSLYSVLLAQYVYTVREVSGEDGNPAAATLGFLMMNLALLLVHIFVVWGDVVAQMKQASHKVIDYFHRIHDNEEASDEQKNVVEFARTSEHIDVVKFHDH